MIRKYLWSFVLIMLFSAFISCDKSDKKSGDKWGTKAIIIGFNQEKCDCCWGWIIQMGNDTIMTDNSIVGEKIGYEINEPIHVYIELGEKEKECPILMPSPIYNKDYFEIRKIEIMENNEPQK